VACGAKARVVAKSIAQQLAAGTGHVMTLTPSAVADYTAALKILRKYPDISLASVCQQYAYAHDLMGNNGTLQDAVAVFIKTKSKSALPEITVEKLIGQFFEAKEREGLSIYYLVDLKRKLKRFSRSFHCSISSIQPQQIKAWITKQATSKSFRNLHSAISTLFSFAREKGYLPEEKMHAAERVTGVKAKPAPIGIYNPEELAKILAATEKRLLPAIAIAAFTGIRSAEIFRLDWSDVKMDQGHIVVGADKAKTASRRIVPILPALEAWLMPHIKNTGRVTPDFSNLDNFTRKFATICKSAGVTQHHNGFRHSYASYRLTTIKSADAVALEMGNSPRKLFTNYRELVTEDAGNAWFATLPPRTLKLKTSARKKGTLRKS